MPKKSALQGAFLLFDFFDFMAASRAYTCTAYDFQITVSDIHVFSLLQLSLPFTVCACNQLFGFSNIEFHERFFRFTST